MATKQKVVRKKGIRDPVMSVGKVKRFMKERHGDVRVGQAGAQLMVDILKMYAEHLIREAESVMPAKKQTLSTTDLNKALLSSHGFKGGAIKGGRVSAASVEYAETGGANPSILQKGSRLEKASRAGGKAKKKSKDASGSESESSGKKKKRSGSKKGSRKGGKKSKSKGSKGSKKGSKKAKSKGKGKKGGK